MLCGAQTWTGRAATRSILDACSVLPPPMGRTGRLIPPHAVRPVKYGHEVVSESVLSGIWAFACFAALAGVVMAPALAMQSMLVAKTGSAESSAEAFTWSATGLLAGVGLGFATGGLILEAAGSAGGNVAPLVRYWAQDGFSSMMSGTCWTRQG